MDDDLQQQALGRANAACAALFALFERFEGDPALTTLFAQHCEFARDALLNTRTPDTALREFDKTASELLHRLTAKTP